MSSRAVSFSSAVLPLSAYITFKYWVSGMQPSARKASMASSGAMMTMAVAAMALSSSCVSYRGPARAYSSLAMVTVGAASSTARAKGVTMSMLFAKAQVPAVSSTGSWPCSARAPLKSESDTTVRCVVRTEPKSSRRSVDGSTPVASAAATRGS